MARSLDSEIIRNKNQLHGGAAFHWLFDFDRDGTNNYRVTPNPEAIVYRGNTYSPVAMQVQPIGESAGVLGQVRLTTSNIIGTMQGYLGDDEVLDRRCTVRLIVGTQAGTTSGAASATYSVRSAVASRDAVVMTLGTWALSQVPAPRDRFLRTRCRWVFQGTECGYAGALTTCDKSFDASTGCLGRANQPSYGGFPYLLSGSEAMGMLGVA